MTTVTIVLAILLVLLVIVASLLPRLFGDRRPAFEYGRKDCIVTPAEHECYAALISELGTEYRFFPQIHLDSILIPKSSGQARFHAFRHINQKSVDFVICDPTHLRPLAAIELDDKTHRQAKRIARDREVERILHGAGIPVIRIQNRGRIVPKELAQQVRQAIENYATQPAPVP